MEVNRHRCNICKRNFKMRPGRGNMPRHIRLMHPEVYQMEMQQKSKNQVKYTNVQDAETDFSEEYIEEVLETEEEYLDEHVEESDNTSKAELKASGSPEAIAYQDIDNLDTEWETKDYGDIEYLSDTDPELEDKIKWLAQRIVPGKSK